MAVNDELLDRAVSHAIGLYRYGSGLVKDILKLVAKVEGELVDAIPRTEPQAWRLNRMIKDFGEITTEGYGAVRKQAEGDLFDLAVYESQFQEAVLVDEVPLKLEVTKPSRTLLRAVVTEEPFQGALLKEWVQGLSDGQYRRTRDAVRIGVTSGETSDAIVKRLTGTRAANYKDGAFEVSRRSAESMVRTAVNHVATASRELLYNENPDLVKGVRWVATLDSRTTPICQHRDGMVFKPNEGPRPPAHINCRSTTVPILVSWEDLGLDIGDVPVGTRASMNGQVPADLTYGEWLRKQSAAFQDEVLGPTRGKLFRSGGLSVDRFVDETGHRYTLAELKRREKSAFKKAGLND